MTKVTRQQDGLEGRGHLAGLKLKLSQHRLVIDDRREVCKSLCQPWTLSSKKAQYLHRAKAPLWWKTGGDSKLHGSQEQGCVFLFLLCVPAAPRVVKAA